MGRIVSFSFKSFDIDDRRCAMKVGTDAVVLGATATCDDACTVVDIGAGSGIVALMIAQRCQADITAVEIDHGAAQDCKANFEASPWSDRLSVVCDSYDLFEPDSPVDLIVSNPPFFANGELSPVAERAKARHSAELSPCSLLDYAAGKLSDNGRLSMVIPYQQVDQIVYEAEMRRLKQRLQIDVRQRRNLDYVRSVVEFSLTDGKLERRQITICGDDGKRSPQFSEITRNFYL